MCVCSYVCVCICLCVCFSVCVFLCMSVCECLCVYLCECILVIGDPLGCHFSVTLHVAFWGRVCQIPIACWIGKAGRPMSLKDLPVSSSEPWDYTCPQPTCFFMWYWALQSSIHACTTNPLLTELSHKPLKFQSLPLTPYSTSIAWCRGFDILSF